MACVAGDDIAGWFVILGRMAKREGYRWFRGGWQPSPAERRVLAELVAGRTNAEIAVRLGGSPETVKSHIARLLAETGCDDRAALADWWRDRAERPPLAAPLLGLGGRLIAGLVAAALAVTLLLAGGPAVARLLSAARSAALPSGGAPPGPELLAQSTPTPAPTATPARVFTPPAGDPASLLLAYIEALNRYAWDEVQFVADDVTVADTPLSVCWTPCAGKAELQNHLLVLLQHAPELRVADLAVQGDTATARVELRWRGLTVARKVERIVDRLTVRAEGGVIAAIEAEPDLADAETASVYGQVYPDRVPPRAERRPPPTPTPLPPLPSGQPAPTMTLAETSAAAGAGADARIVVGLAAAVAGSVVLLASGAALDLLRRRPGRRG
jgi:DNA-binding CsgD family transcriptional regulator